MSNPQKIEQEKNLAESIRREWLTNPVAYVYSLWPYLKLWQKQVDVLCSLKDNSRTVVKSGNTCGKTFISALAVHWWMDTHYPAKVVTTAPGWNQVHGVLWKDIATLFNKSSFPKGGEMLQAEWKVSPEHFAFGISTDDVNRMQGWHSPNLLVVIDEAQGLEPSMWEAIEGLHPKAILAIGNPLDASGEFFECFSSPLWKQITISCLECVDWQSKHGMIDGLTTTKWITERRDEWGPKSPLFQSRVLGEFPEETSDTLIPRRWLDEARKRDLKEQEEDEIRVVGNDVASKHGDCENVIGYRYGHTVVDLDGFYRISMMETRDKIGHRWGVKKAQSVVVDADGIGEGLPEMLAQLQIPCWSFHGGYGQHAIDSNKFRNLRSQFYWIVAKKFEKGLYDLSRLSDKAFELVKNQLCCIKVKPPDAMGRIQIETKEDLMARGIKSPDFADCFMLMEYGFYMGKYQDVAPLRYR